QATLARAYLDKQYRSVFSPNDEKAFFEAMPIKLREDLLNLADKGLEASLEKDANQTNDDTDDSNDELSGTGKNLTSDAFLTTVDYLVHADPEQRWKAAYLLGKVGQPVAVNPLLQA